MERQKRDIYEQEESDDEINDCRDSDEDRGEHEYCFASVPTSKLQARKVLSTARWVNEMRMAEVEAPKGPIWRTAGIVRRGKIYCLIEEALFLAELGALSLVDDVGSSVSLEDVYGKLSDEKNGCCWDYFQAYRQLKSLGYIVGRHGIPWSLKSVNGNSKSSSSSSELSLESVAESKLEDEISITGMFSQMHIGEARAVFDVYPPNSKFRKSCPGVPSFVLCFTRGYPPSKATLELLGKACRVPLKFCHVEQGKVSFYSFDKVELPVLP